MKNIYLILMLLCFTQNVLANPTENLQESRQIVMKQYIKDLGEANYHDIIQLFSKDGMVVSTSRGKMNAKDFFNAFLPYIQSAKTTIHQSFNNDTDKNRYAVRFHFNYKMKDGEEGEGEYVDEFVFEKDSSVLSMVYMFENLHVNE